MSGALLKYFSCNFNTKTKNRFFSLQVKIWFQNRRAKERRALKKHEDVIMKEKIDSAATFGAGMGYVDSIHAAGNLAMTAGGCHPAMLGGHATFPPHSLATSIMTGSPQLAALGGGAMKFEWNENNNQRNDIKIFLPLEDFIHLNYDNDNFWTVKLSEAFFKNETVFFKV